MNHRKTDFGIPPRLCFLQSAKVALAPALARQLYERAKQTNQTLYATYTFEQWIGFLMQSGLLAMDATGNYVLTNYGRGFLKYIVDRQLTMFRPN